MSLRTKYLLATAIAVLVPLLGYLVLDALSTRSFLVREQAQGLRRMADWINGSFEDIPSLESGQAERWLGRFSSRHLDLEVMVLDLRSRVLAGSRPERVGRNWLEPGIQEVLSGKMDFHWAKMEHDGRPVLDVTVPWLDAQGKLRGAVHLAQDLSVVDAQIEAIQVRHAVFVVMVALLVGGLLSFLTYILVIKRLGALDSELHHSRMDSPGPGLRGPGDEIDHLSAALRNLVGNLSASAVELEQALTAKGELLVRVEGFNLELEQQVDRTRQELLTVQAELIRGEHLSTIGQLSAGLAHELRNPLFIIRASAETMARRAPDAKDMAVDIMEEVDRVDGIIKQLLELGRPLNLEEHEVDICAVLKEVVDQVSRAQPDGKQIDWRFTCEADCRCLGDHPLLRQAFMHLVSNAADAIEGDGYVEIRAAVGPEEEERVRVEVRDNGRGIAAEDQAHVFEPFFTRKKKGTGLGLAASSKILVVDDEPKILKLIRNRLEEAGHRIETCSDVASA
ncbi:MAG: hypothetical protein JRF33_20895, partial [Deltaproteobacteria bacterium]|nr:hypothetical protein [Deltaproteobacteria bacterium]